MARGEAGVLTAEPVRAWEETGGSSGGAKLVPYTANAIQAVLAHEEPVPSRTQPYGCSVKY